MFNRFKVIASVLLVLTVACNGNIEISNKKEESNKIAFLNPRIVDSIRDYSSYISEQTTNKQKVLYIVDIDEYSENTSVKISAYEFIPETINNSPFDGMLFIDNLNVVISDNRKQKRIHLYDAEKLNKDTLNHFYPSITDIETGRCSPIYNKVEFKW